MEYVILAVRGACIVGLVSWQTLNLQRGAPVPIACGAFLIGLSWYSNVLAAIAQIPYGWLAYSSGSMVGAVVGGRIHRWL